MIASRSCCRFVVCTSMMRISRSTTSQRCSTGLRSGDCGGHLSEVNSLSCSRNQSEMIWALWHGALSCWRYIRRWYTVVIKGWTWSATILRQRSSNLLLSNFGDPVWIVSSVCCSYLTGAAPGVVFCCWSPSASGFDVLCVQRCILQILVVTSGYLSYCCLSIISNQSVHSPLTSDINKTFSSTQLPVTGYFLFFRPFSVNPRDGCVWKSQ